MGCVYRVLQFNFFMSNRIVQVCPRRVKCNPVFFMGDVRSTSESVSEARRASESMSEARRASESVFFLDKSRSKPKPISFALQVLEDIANLT